MIRASTTFNDAGDIISIILIKEDGTSITHQECVEALIEYANLLDAEVNKSVVEEV